MCDVHCLLGPLDAAMPLLPLRRDVNMSADGMEGMPSTESLVTESSTLYFGQLKLFISELEFLTPFHDQDIVVVYGGAAPGYHLPFVIALFPKMKFILVDPDRMALQNISSDIATTLENVFDFSLDSVMSRVQFHNRILTADEDCDPATHLWIGSLRGDKPMLFISDIRNVEIGLNKDSAASHQTIIHDDMELQQRLALVLRAESSLLKFRLPWQSVGGIDHRNYPYLSCSHMRYQVYTSHASHEARIVVSKANLDHITVYDGLRYELAMQNFQVNIRRAVHKQPVRDELDSQMRCLKDQRYVQFYNLFKNDYDVPPPTQEMFQAYEEVRGPAERATGIGKRPFRLHEDSLTRNRAYMNRSVYLSSLCSCYDCVAFDHIIKCYLQKTGTRSVENITTGVPRGIRYFKWMLDHAVHAS
jgi:Poly A polymerase regulatory subunit